MKAIVSPLLAGAVIALGAALRNGSERGESDRRRIGCLAPGVY